MSRRKRRVNEQEDTTASSVRRLRALAGALVIVAALALFTIAPAVSFGQESTTESAVTTASPTSDTDASSDDGEADEDQTADDGLSVTAFVFGLVALALLLAYLYLVQNRFFNTADRFIQKQGNVPPAKDVDSIVRYSTMQTVGPPQPSLAVSGPGVVTVGIEAEFSITPDAEAGEAKWTVVPADLASPASATGDTFKFKAQRAGAFTVNVERGDATGSASVTAVGDSGAKLPFVGAGYGTVVLATILITATIVLGLEDVLDGQAVATLFGALAGYIFHKASGESDSGTAETGGTSGESTTTTS